MNINYLEIISAEFNKFSGFDDGISDLIRCESSLFKFLTVD